MDKGTSRPSAGSSSRPAHTRCALESLEQRRLLAAAVALDADNQLLFFDTGSPGTITSTVQISGLDSGESILAIDYRPANRVFYGLGSAGRLYYINRSTGVAIQIGSDFAIPLQGDSFDLDVDPLLERIRIVSNADQNLRVNPDTGAIVDFDPAAPGVQPDGELAFAAGDLHQGDDPIVIAAAYNTNIFGGAPPTLYALDSAANALLKIGSAGGAPVSPNSGQLFTVGPLGVDISKRSSLDIMTVGGIDTALAVLTAAGQTDSQLYTINLDTGAATVVGAVGARRIVDATIAPAPPLAIALTTGNQLLAFFTNDPTNILRRTRIRGLDTGENIVGIDIRPATGELFGISNVGRLYTINPRVGRTTRIGADAAIALNGRDVGFGFDFNPTDDRIRLTSNADQNLRLNPDTGSAIDNDTVLAGLQPDGTLFYDTDTDGAGPDAGDVNAGADPLITASAYSNNDTDPVTATVLYGIDTNLDILVRQDPPNAGVLNTVGSLGVDVVTRTGFDILTTDGLNEAYAALQLDGQTRAGLYRINLATGLAMRVGSIGGNRTLVGLAMLSA